MCSSGREKRDSKASSSRLDSDRPVKRVAHTLQRKSKQIHNQTKFNMLLILVATNASVRIRQKTSVVLTVLEAEYGYVPLSRTVMHWLRGFLTRSQGDRGSSWPGSHSVSPGKKRKEKIKSNKRGQENENKTPLEALPMRMEEILEGPRPSGGRCTSSLPCGESPQRMWRCEVKDWLRTEPNWDQGMDRSTDTLHSTSWLLVPHLASSSRASTGHMDPAPPPEHWRRTRTLYESRGQTKKSPIFSSSSASDWITQER